MGQKEGDRKRGAMKRGKERQGKKVSPSPVSSCLSLPPSSLTISLCTFILLDLLSLTHAAFPPFLFLPSSFTYPCTRCHFPSPSPLPRSFPSLSPFQFYLCPFLFLFRPFSSLTISLYPCLFMSIPSFSVDPYVPLF